MSGTRIETLQSLLSEALDLCVRARKLHEPWEWKAEHEAANPDATRCATIPLWVQDQYDRDLADWEKRARAALLTPNLAKDPL